MVEGPRILKKKLESHLETVGLITRLRVGEKIVVWEDFASDSQKPMWLLKGDIGNVIEVDGDGSVIVTFPGKDSGGKSLTTFIKKSKIGMLRVELPGATRLTRPRQEGQPVKQRRVGSTPEETAKAASVSSSAPAAAAPERQAVAEEKPMSEEEKAAQAKAEAWLSREPKKGVVRFTFKEPGPLGLRFSKDIPPWILVVNDGSPASRKAPRVPVAGIVTAVNGYEITAKDCQDVMAGLKKRPVVLDVDWPVDQDLPIVNRA